MSRLGLTGLRGFGGDEPLYPPVDPAESRDFFDRALENSLGGLRWAGDFLDKPGRAVRGILGGSAREALAVLPLSDSLGLTDPAEVVSGRRLLENWGVASPKAEGAGFDWGADLAGLGLEMLTDPLTYIPFGAATKAGRIANNAGDLRRVNTADRIAGYGAKLSEIRQVMNPLDRVETFAEKYGITGPIMSAEAEAAAQAAGLAVSPRNVLNFGDTVVRGVDSAGNAVVQRFPHGDPGIQQFAATLADSEIEPTLASITRQRGTPLAGAFGLGLPFGEATPLLTGRLGERIARNNPIALAGAAGSLLSRGVESLTGFSPARQLQTTFNPDVLGATTGVVQDVNAGTTSRVIDDSRRIADDARASFLLDFRKVVQGLPPGQLNDALVAVREGAENVPASVGSLPPNVLAQLRQIGAADAAVVQANADRATRLGVPLSPLDDDFAAYATRSYEFGPKGKGQTWTQYLSDRDNAMTARNASQIKREDYLRDIPGGSEAVNRWAADPQLAGRSRPLQNAQVADELVRRVLPQVGQQQSPNLWRAAEEAAVKQLDEQIGRIERDLATATPASLPTLTTNLQSLAAQRGGLKAAIEAGAATPAASLPLVQNTLPAVVKERMTQLASKLGERPDEWVNAGTPFFSRDFGADLATGLNRIGTSEAAAEMAITAAAKAARPLQDGDVPIRSLFDKMGLIGRSDRGFDIAEQAMRVRAGDRLNGIDTELLGIPADVAADLLATNARWVNPREIKPGLAALDALSSLFKTNVTTPFPAYHVRNTFGGLYDSARSAGVLNTLRAIPEAWAVSRGRDAWTMPTDQLLREAVGTGTAYTMGSSQAAGLIGGIGETTLKNLPLPRKSDRWWVRDLAGHLYDAVPKTRAQAAPWNVRGVATDTDVFAPVAAGRAVGEPLEQFTRLTNFLALRNAGLNPVAAADRTKLFQRDYGRLTQTEKEVFKRIVPFYSFSRRNIPSLAASLTEKPGVLSNTLRVGQAGQEYGSFVPSYVADSVAIPLGESGPGQQRYISGLGLPVEDATVRALAKAIRGDLQGSAQQLAGTLNPLVKAPLELLTDTSLYSGRRLTEMRPSTTAQYLPLGEQGQRLVTSLLGNSPLARVMSTTDRLIDQRKGTVPTAFNTLTGIQLTDVDQQLQELLARKRVAENLLIGRDGVRRGQQVYLSKKSLEEGKVSPETVYLYRLMMGADRDLRDAPR